jgi:hypothetical protein
MAVFSASVLRAVANGETAASKQKYSGLLIGQAAPDELRADAEVDS